MYLAKSFLVSVIKIKIKVNHNRKRPKTWTFSAVVNQEVCPTAEYRKATSSKEHVANEKELVMSNDTFGLDVVQAAELKYAWARNGGTNADLKALSAGDMVAQILPILRGYGNVVVELFQPIGEVAFPGSTNFAASEKLVINTADDATVKILGFGSNFTNLFLPKAEGVIAPSTLGYGKLLRRANAQTICNGLGGEVPAETTLAEIYYLTTLQPNGPKSGAGALLTNGWGNLFLVRDVNGVLRLVCVYWRDGGWYFNASELSDAYEWFDGRQVFSRKLTVATAA